MSIESDLKKDGITVVGKLDTLKVNSLAHSVTKKICKAFPEQNFIFQNLFIALSRIPMYIAQIPEGYAEANYFYKNSSIYFKEGKSNEELEKFAVHEFIHYLQEIKDKNGHLVKLGLCNFGDLKIQGMALNEGAVQLMAAKALEQKEEIVKYYGISLPTTSPNYYPILCNLVSQMAYLVGEDALIDSTFYGSDLFKARFCDLCGVDALLKIQNNLDKILEIEEKIIVLNQTLVSDNCEGMKAQRVAHKISKNKDSIKKIFFSTQELIYSSYFNTQFSKILTTSDIESYRYKLYNYKNYIGITEEYHSFNDFYINKMMELDTRYDEIINNTKIAVVSESWFSSFFRKIRSIFSPKPELN